MTTQTQTVEKRGGIGFLGLLTIVFITLKLTGFIGWSWWLVLLPLYGPIATVLTILALFFITAFIVGLFGGGSSKPTINRSSIRYRKR